MSPGVLDLVDTLTWQRGAHRVRVTGGWEHLSLTSAQAIQEGPVVTLYGPTDLLATPALRPLYDALPPSLRSSEGPAPTFDEILQLPVRSVTMGVGDPSQPGPYNRDAVSHPDVLRLAVDHAWTVRPRVTLQYGLRYAYRSNIFNQDLERPAYLAPLLGGDLDPPHRGRHSFDPTLGLAWAPGAGGRTVVRLGAGLYHDDIDFFTPFLERGPLGPSGNGRVVVDGSVAGISFLSGPTAFRGVDLLPLLPGIRTTIASRLGDGSDPSVRGIEVLKQGDFIFDPGHSTPRALHAAAGVQRQLRPGLSLSVDFVLRRVDGLGGFTGRVRARPEPLQPPARDRHRSRDGRRVVRARPGDPAVQRRPGPRARPARPVLDGAHRRLPERRHCSLPRAAREAGQADVVAAAAHRELCAGRSAPASRSSCATTTPPPGTETCPGRGGTA